MKFQRWQCVQLMCFHEVDNLKDADKYWFWLGFLFLYLQYKSLLNSRILAASFSTCIKARPSLHFLFLLVLNKYNFWDSVWISLIIHSVAFIFLIWVLLHVCGVEYCHLIFICLAAVCFTYSNQSQILKCLPLSSLRPQIGHYPRKALGELIKFILLENDLALLCMYHPLFGCWYQRGTYLYKPLYLPMCSY